MLPEATYEEQVFVNCPFDKQYERLHNAIIFAVYDCGFVARSALETVDSSEVRIEKIMRLIGECKLGLHELSRTDLDPVNSLPRFNMPLELGIFLGAKRFGGRKHRDKNCLILDREPYRYQIFCSDIAGQDILSHEGDPSCAVKRVRDWLSPLHPTVAIPGGGAIWARYQQFEKEMPGICAGSGLESRTLTFNDYTEVLTTWLREFP